MIENRLLPTSIIEKELPSQKVKEDLYHYKIRARTCYKELEPPSLDLENYITHKVSYMNDKGLKVDDEDEKRRKRLLRIHYKKPNLDQYRIQSQPQIQEQPKIANQANFGSIVIPTMPTQTNKATTEEQLPPQLDAQGQPIITPAIPPP